MKEFDIERFKRELKECTIESFLEYKQTAGLEDLCGFAFYTDAEFSSLSVFINTTQFLKQHPAGEPYYKFTVDEWSGDTGYPIEKLDSINLILDEQADEDEMFIDVEYVSALYECCVDVIAEMKEEGVFDGVSEDFIWNVAVSDSDNPPLEIETFRKLNTPELADTFEKYLIKEYKTCPSDQWSYKKGQWKSDY